MQSNPRTYIVPPKIKSMVAIKLQFIERTVKIREITESGKRAKNGVYRKRQLT